MHTLIHHHLAHASAPRLARPGEGRARSRAPPTRPPATADGRGPGSARRPPGPRAGPSRARLGPLRRGPTRHRREVLAATRSCTSHAPLHDRESNLAAEATASVRSAGVPRPTLPSGLDEAPIPLGREPAGAQPPRGRGPLRRSHAGRGPHPPRRRPQPSRALARRRLRRHPTGRPDQALQPRRRAARAAVLPGARRRAARTRSCSWTRPRGRGGPAHPGRAARDGDPGPRTRPRGSVRRDDRPLHADGVHELRGAGAGGARLAGRGDRGPVHDVHRARAHAAPRIRRRLLAGARAALEAHSFSVDLDPLGMVCTAGDLVELAGRRDSSWSPSGVMRRGR